MGHQARYDASNTSAEATTIVPASIGFRPNQVPAGHESVPAVGLKLVTGSEFTPGRLSKPGADFTFFRLPLDMVC